MAACITPFTRRDPLTQEWQVFPCGKCPECLKRRVSGWSFRLIKESERSHSAIFVTLTYDVDHVPLTEKGFMTLRKSDVQKFFKRLRKIDPEAQIKYYAVGEYGGRTLRPHYHIILFNSSHANISSAWRLEGKPLGDIHYGDVSGASVGYTLKYMTKEGKIPLHKNDDRVPEFSLMSKDLAPITLPIR